MININLSVCGLMTVPERIFRYRAGVDVGYVPIPAAGSIGEDRTIGRRIIG
jgi:hypothetical protein